MLLPEEVGDGVRHLGGDLGAGTQAGSAGGAQAGSAGGAHKRGGDGIYIILYFNLIPTGFQYKALIMI
jgi:hypothetical protein